MSESVKEDGGVAAGAAKGGAGSSVTEEVAKQQDALKEKGNALFVGGCLECWDCLRHAVCYMQ